MLHQLTITCDYPAQLIGFHMQNSTDNTELTFNALVPINDSDEALYAWGTPEDASDVQHRHSDTGSCIYRFETPLPPLEWLTATILPAVNIYINITIIFSWDWLRSSCLLKPPPSAAQQFCVLSSNDEVDLRALYLQSCGLGLAAS